MDYTVVLRSSDTFGNPTLAKFWTCGIIKILLYTVYTNTRMQLKSREALQRISNSVFSVLTNSLNKCYSSNESCNFFNHASVYLFRKIYLNFYFRLYPWLKISNYPRNRGNKRSRNALSGLLTATWLINCQRESIRVIFGALNRERSFCSLNTRMYTYVSEHI